MAYCGKIDYANQRCMRTRNKRMYRLAHWPIWIWVFFLAPGPLVFSMFASGFSRWNSAWLGIVLISTGIAALRGSLPGSEPAPYILRFDEDRPNPLYRRVCYTFAWNAVVNFALLNFIGLAAATVTGTWHLKQIYWYGYPLIGALILLLGATGMLPRVKPSTRGEGTERRYFYGSVWAVTIAQAALLVVWKLLLNTREASAIKLVIFAGVLAAVGLCASRGRLPRTRPIVAGELMVAD